MSQSPKDSDIAELGFLKRGKYWPAIIVGMLVLHASIILGTLAFISARHDLYVEPDYYAKSIEWDSQRALFESADKMGWQITIVVGEPSSPTDQAREFLVTIVDANADPIDRALVELDVYHPTHASERTSHVLLGIGQGQYKASTEMTNPGFWQAHLAIRHQGVEALVKREIQIH